MVEAGEGGDPQPGSYNALDPSQYTADTNLVWDVHYYGWIVNGSTDMTTIANSITNLVQETSGITDADGAIPVIIGEYGNSTTGGSDDADGMQVVEGVQQSGLGSIAWYYSPYGANNGDIDNLYSPSSLTDYGQEVANFFATNAATSNSCTSGQ